MTDHAIPQCRFHLVARARFVMHRHVDDCDDEQCAGCVRCTERHCVVCTATHVGTDTLACADCLAALREALHDIVLLCDALPGQAAFGGEAGHLLAGAPIPGGDAMVLLGPGSDGRAQVREMLWEATDAPHSDDERSGDPEPPLALLASWEDDWRLLWAQPAGPRATLPNAAAYLLRNLARAAATHPAFDEFADAIFGCRARLEDVLHDGERDETGAPCVHCGATLIRRSMPPRTCRHDVDDDVGNSGDVCTCDHGGLRDEWRCPRCRRVYDSHSYWNAVGAAYRAHATAMTAADISTQYGIPAGSVQSWASRGLIRRRGRDAAGRRLYDVDDVRVRAGAC